MIPRQVASLEIRRLLRSPGILLAAVGFAGVAAGGVAIPRVALEEANADLGTAFLLGPAVDLLLPLVVILLSYGAVAGHRDRGSIHMLLAAPSRREGLFAAVWLARTAIVLGIVAAGLIAGIVTIHLLYGPPPAAPVFEFVLLTALAAVTFTSVGVGVSAATARPVRALAILVAGFVLAHAVWEPLVRGTEAMTRAESGGNRVADLAIMANPLAAYRTIANARLPPSPHLALEVDGAGASATAGELVGGEVAATDQLVGIAVLLGWTLLGLGIGVVRFRTAEID